MNQEKALDFLTRSLFGRVLLGVLTKRFVSVVAGKYMNSSLSRRRIPDFIAENGINIDEYEDAEYSSFNDFFTRRIKPSSRTVATEKGAFVCPCDSRLSAYEITRDLIFFIKGAPYNVSTLLGGDETASEFADGSALVFRLSVDDYHRYAFFDSGSVISKPRHIKGIYHSVNPIVLEKYNFFHQNSREYTVLDCEHFGKAVYCEIGALLVGRIVNHDIDVFSAGEEKGYFEFGGSTVVVLLGKDRRIDRRFYDATAAGEETRVLFGENLCTDCN